MVVGFVLVMMLPGNTVILMVLMCSAHDLGLPGRSRMRTERHRDSRDCLQRQPRHQQADDAEPKTTHPMRIAVGRRPSNTQTPPAGEGSLATRSAWPRQDPKPC